MLLLNTFLIAVCFLHYELQKTHDKKWPKIKQGYPIYMHLSVFVDKMLCPKLEEVEFHQKWWCCKDYLNCGVELLKFLLVSKVRSRCLSQVAAFSSMLCWEKEEAANGRK